MTSELQKYFSISFVMGAHTHKSSFVIVSKGTTNPWYRVPTEIFISMILFKIKIMMTININGNVNIAMIQEFFLATICLVSIQRCPKPCQNTLPLFGSCLWNRFFYVPKFNISFLCRASISCFAGQENGYIFNKPNSLHSYGCKHRKN